MRTSAFQKHTNLIISLPSYRKTQPKRQVPTITWVTAVCLSRADGASPPCSSWACCSVPSSGTAGHAQGHRGRAEGRLKNVSSEAVHLIPCKALIPLSHRPSPLIYPPSAPARAGGGTVTPLFHEGFCPTAIKRSHTITGDKEMQWQGFS